MSLRALSSQWPPSASTPAALLSFALLAISAVFAVPVVGQREISKFMLALVANINATGSSNIAELDRAHAAILRSNGLAKKRDGNVAVTNAAW